MESVVWRNNLLQPVMFIGWKISQTVQMGDESISGLLSLLQDWSEPHSHLLSTIKLVL